jgi:transposase-like protein
VATLIRTNNLKLFDWRISWKKRKNNHYTEEFKRSSAKLAVESDQSIVATARNLDVNEVTLHGWIKRYYSAPPPSSASTDKIDAYSELQRLKN